MVLYTKTGDKGKTSLFKGDRVLKSNPQIEAIGAIDELNSYLGIVISSSQDQVLNRRLKDIQRDLLSIDSIIAGSKLRFFTNKTGRLEKETDKLEGGLPRLKNFIVPGGDPVAAQLQYARALARRAERIVVALSNKEKVRPEILAYFNRLSDFLFILARKVNHDLEIKEEIWKGK